MVFSDSIRSATAICACLLLAAGCSLSLDEDDLDFDGSSSASGSRTDGPTDPGLRTNKVDILWVVDNSGSMCEEQQSLRENFDAFVDVMDDANIDFHLAVVTTDLANFEEAGHFQNVPKGNPGQFCDIAVDISGCPTPGNGNDLPLVIRSEDYKNGSAGLDTFSLKRDFGCNAAVGINGDGFEAGLEAAKLALSEPLISGFNTGFLRNDALLAVVFLTDENDCSDRNALDKINGNICEWERDNLVSTLEYADFFASLKGGDHSRVVMGAIIAPDSGERYEFGDEVDPSCVSSFGDGYAGYRYEEVVNVFPNSIVANICAPPYTDMLSSFAQLIDTALDNAP